MADREKAREELVEAVGALMVRDFVEIFAPDMVSDGIRDDFRDDARSTLKRLREALATRPHLANALLPDTHRAVPVEATEEMGRATPIYLGSGDDPHWRAVWRAMVAAASPGLLGTKEGA